MLQNKEAISNWCNRLNLPQEARKAVEIICSSEPSRSVGGRRKNVCGLFPSRKMGVTIQFESRTVELPYIYALEHDNQVLWYFDQPPKIKLNYEADNGREIGFWYTPDFFVMKSDSAGWVECKPEEELQRLSLKRPNFYCLGQDHKWRIPPGEKYAEQFNFSFSVFSDSEIDWNLHRNLQFLDSYYRN